MILRKNIDYYIAFLLFVFSSCFTANVSKISPIYISIGLILILFGGIIYFIISKKIDGRNINIMNYVIFIMCFFVIQMFVSDSFAFLVDYGLIIISYFYLFLGLLFFSDIDFFNLKKIINCYYLITSFLLILDFIYRFINRDSAYEGLMFFYNFKLNGIMFRDSNFSGFVALSNFAFALYLKNRKIINFSKLKLFFYFILILINLSRAAILAGVFVLFYSWFVTRSKKTRLYFFLFILFFLILLIPFLFSLFAEDDSFGTKLDIFTKTWKYIKQINFFQFVFGNGIFTSPNHLGISGHNYFSQTIIEFGFLIFFLHIGLFIVLCFSSYGKCLYLIIPYLIAGLSMAPLSLPYFYIMNALIILIEKGEINGLGKCNNAHI